MNLQKFTSDEKALRAEIVEQYRHAETVGLNELSSGNISCRFGEGMLISPAGATSESITEDTIVYVDADGVFDSAYRPSSEWQMHAAIYQQHERAKAVVHTHSDHCVAMSCHHKPLPGFHYLVGLFGGSDVPCIPYSTFGTKKLAEQAAIALTDRSACLLGSHGMISRAGGLEQAVQLAHRLEILCRQYLLACQLGEPRLLSDEEWEDFFSRARLEGYIQ